MCMRVIGLILLGLLIFIYINIEIMAESPCSSFSRNPSLCSSDNIR